MPKEDPPSGRRRNLCHSCRLEDICDVKEPYLIECGIYEPKRERRPKR